MPVMTTHKVHLYHMPNLGNGDYLIKREGDCLHTKGRGCSNEAINLFTCMDDKEQVF